MATTAAGTPYVESSDLVANYPGVSLALANHIDTIGKVLQVVRATDTTNRTTTSTSFVDVTGMAVTITCQQITSSILLIVPFYASAFGYGAYADYQITNAANTAISGAQTLRLGSSANNLENPLTLIGYDSPATLSAVTYKLRFKIAAGTSANVLSANATGQMYAIEVAA